MIAGAGPAGAIAALILARAGVRVTLVDRASFPRDKLCGDTINPGARTVLRRLGLDHVTAGGLPVQGMIVTGPRGERVTGAYDGHRPGVAISRRELDERLLAAAAAAGAEVRQGVLVQGPVMSDDGGAVVGIELVGASGRVERERARITIAADGRSSRIARTTGLSATPRRPRRWAVGAIFAGVSGLTAYGEMHVRDRCYMGIAPLPGGYANGCVVTGDRALLRDPDVLMTTIRSDDGIADRFAHATRVSDVTVLGPLAVDARAAGMPGLLLAGDAAGFIDPMTGDGLRFALRGAELAAGETLRALDAGWLDAHVRLNAARRGEFAAKWRFNRALRALASSPAAVRVGGVSAVFLPRLLRRVIQYAGDVTLA